MVYLYRIISLISLYHPFPCSLYLPSFIKFLLTRFFFRLHLNLPTHNVKSPVASNRDKKGGWLHRGYSFGKDSWTRYWTNLPASYIHMHKHMYTHKHTCTHTCKSSSNTLKYLPVSLSCYHPIVVKVRKTGKSHFVEVELNELTYAALLRACCRELLLERRSSEEVEICKLPDTLVRKDEDVKRFENGQELEVHVDKSGCCNCLWV